MKRMRPPGYHHNDFVASYALGQSHCGDNRDSTLFS